MGVIKIPISITCDEKFGNVSDVFVSAYPNPASQYIDIDVGNAENFANGYTIDLYDHTSRHIRQITSSDEIYTLHRNDLPSGIYYYSIHLQMDLKLGEDRFSIDDVAFHIAEPAFHTLDPIVHTKVLK
ncbi:T9SS type A sorting domain-containing protein [Candidatus Amarobacter glycogenicus]|uniref:T9SS type A sorting domain-containing protein n=1 Tax=Candidatus Amarobacter glycogenicus TaxID=3140699 RepID=UPI002A112198|nr:T9SS type A sorting domain-containing protein [Dehalococcoidia bacterium]